MPAVETVNATKTGTASTSEGAASLEVVDAVTTGLVSLAAVVSIEAGLISAVTRRTRLRSAVDLFADVLPALTVQEASVAAAGLVSPISLLAVGVPSLGQQASVGESGEAAEVMTRTRITSASLVEPIN